MWYNDAALLAFSVGGTPSFKESPWFQHLGADVMKDENYQEDFCFIKKPMYHWAYVPFLGLKVGGVMGQEVVHGGCG